MRRTPVRIPWATLVSGLLLVVAPKCPLCIAAYLAVAGIGAGAAATLAYAVHPLLWVAAALGLAMFAVQLVQAKKRRRAVPG
jgi:hypothetical protein